MNALAVSANCSPGRSTTHVRWIAVMLSALVLSAMVTLSAGRVNAATPDSTPKADVTTSAPSPAGPIADGGRVVARSVKGGGAVVSSNVGTFVDSSTEGVVKLIGATGTEITRFIPSVIVDGVTRPLEAVISAGGHVVSFTASSAIRVGANLAAVAVEQTGNALQRCTDAGLIPSVTAAVVGAITAGIGGGFVGGLGAIPGAIGGAIVTGFSTFATACLTAAAAGVVHDTLDGSLPGQIIAIPFS